ncbi:MAG: ribonuclease HI [Clostridia bacterium]|nr:ribonuclease HI [Clostridia bacterium]
MKEVIIYTDGACSQNPGPGGWGCVLIYGEHEKELYGFEPDTTNNRMELRAAIEALRALKEPCKVLLYTDSAYLCNAINERWLVRWRANGWKTTNKNEVSNIDLWKELNAEMDKHSVEVLKVKGHADNQYNILCDKLAKRGVSECKASNS